jgi:hypothetical protein
LKQKTAPLEKELNWGEGWLPRVQAHAAASHKNTHPHRHGWFLPQEQAQEAGRPAVSCLAVMGREKQEMGVKNRHIGGGKSHTRGLMSGLCAHAAHISAT